MRSRGHHPFYPRAPFLHPHARAVVSGELGESLQDPSSLVPVGQVGKASLLPELDLIAVLALSALVEPERQHLHGADASGPNRHESQQSFPHERIVGALGLEPLVGESSELPDYWPALVDLDAVEDAIAVRYEHAGPGIDHGLCKAGLPLLNVTDVEMTLGPASAVTGQAFIRDLEVLVVDDEVGALRGGADGLDVAIPVVLASDPDAIHSRGWTRLAG